MTAAKREAREADYARIIERIFFEHFRKGKARLPFGREEIPRAATELGLGRPKNVGDVLYSFRYRRPLPDRIVATAPAGKEWTIRGVGKAKYCFLLATQARVVPDPLLAETKIPDATPGIIARYALTDEQALLAILRYNRLIDIFTGATTYSLQSHLRTSVKGVGPIETDEVYVGVDKQGVQYVFPIQAKGGRDKLGIVQVEQDLGMCREKFPSLVCVPICAQFISPDTVAMFAFEVTRDGIRKTAEKHYKLVAPKNITPEDLEAYRKALR